MIKRVKTQNNGNNNKMPFIAKVGIILFILITLGVLIVTAVRNKVSTILAEENTTQNLVLKDFSFPQYTSTNANELTLMAYGTGNFTLSDNNNVPLMFTTSDTEFLNGARAFYINVNVTRMTNTMYVIAIILYSDQAMQTELFRMNYTTMAQAPYMVYRTGYSSTNYNQPNNILKLQNGGFRISGSHQYKPTSESVERTGNANVSTDSRTYFVLTKLMNMQDSWTSTQDTYNRGLNEGLAQGKSDGIREVVNDPNRYNLYTYDQYNENYQRGINETSEGLSMNWFTMIFSTIASVLSLKMFGNVSLGMIVLIPFSITFVWFIVKSFRGGD